MAEMTRKFEDKEAVRQKVPLLVGLFGPSGSGKTYSALRLAEGIRDIAGGDIFVVDTESKRALHYADRFRFRHVEFGAPFSPLDYLAALQYCVGKGARTIIVDSMSHEHEGPGGYLMTQEAELDRIAGTDQVKRKKATYSAWIVPAKQRRQFINGVLQLNANFIFCFRAKEKLKIKPGSDPVELGYMPIAGEEFLFEMTVNALLLPGACGVPTWKTDYPGERKMLKLPEQFRDLFLKGEKSLDEGIGRTLAQWAIGGSTEPRIADEPRRSEGSHSAKPNLFDVAREKARAGRDTFDLWRQRLKTEQSDALNEIVAELEKLLETLARATPTTTSRATTHFSA